MRKTKNEVHLDARDRLDTLMLQARSLSALLYGAGGEQFRCYSDEIQDSVLWLLSDLIFEASEQIPLALAAEATREAA